MQLVFSARHQKDRMTSLFKDILFMNKLLIILSLFKFVSLLETLKRNVVIRLEISKKCGKTIGKNIYSIIKIN